MEEQHRQYIVSSIQHFCIMACNAGYSRYRQHDFTKIDCLCHKHTTHTHNNTLRPVYTQFKRNECLCANRTHIRGNDLIRSSYFWLSGYPIHLTLLFLCHCRLNLQFCIILLFILKFGTDRLSQFPSCTKLIERSEDTESEKKNRKRTWETWYVIHHRQERVSLQYIY